MSFVRNLSHKYGKQLLDTATKTGLNALKAASKALVHKAAEATGEYIVIHKHVSNENSRSAEEIIIAPEKREEILNELRQVL